MCFRSCGMELIHTAHLRALPPLQTISVVWFWSKVSNPSFGRIQRVVINRHWPKIVLRHIAVYVEILVDGTSVLLVDVKQFSFYS